MSDYKDEYTCDELDKIEDSPLFDSLTGAQKHQQLNGGEIYTQVDSDRDDSVVYSKGTRYVNRTGIYAVVRL